MGTVTVAALVGDAATAAAAAASALRVRGGCAAVAGVTEVGAEKRLLRVTGVATAGGEGEGEEEETAVGEAAPAAAATAEAGIGEEEWRAERRRPTRAEGAGVVKDWATVASAGVACAPVACGAAAATSAALASFLRLCSAFSLVRRVSASFCRSRSARRSSSRRALAAADADAVIGMRASRSRSRAKTLAAEADEVDETAGAAAAEAVAVVGGCSKSGTGGLWCCACAGAPLGRRKLGRIGRCALAFALACSGAARAANDLISVRCAPAPVPASLSLAASALAAADSAAARSRCKDAISDRALALRSAASFACRV